MLVAGAIVCLFNCGHFVASALAWSGLTGNRIALYVSALPIILQLVFTCEPTLQALFRTSALDARSWLLITGLALLNFFAVEIEKVVQRRLNVVRL